MTTTFQRATKARGLLRLGLMGPPGSGKTYSALAIAKGLVGDSIAVVDSERGSASLYAGTVADFAVLELASFEVERYLDAIKEAAKAGFRCLIIDSLSHAWAGVGGLLERVDQIARRSKSANSFAAWRDVTPMHNQLVDAILSYPGHVIVTMRSKVEYVLEEDSRGKKAPRKVGMAPIQRDGLEYEFTVVIDIDNDNYGAVTKTRCPALAGAVIHRPGAQLAETLLAWLNDGGNPRPMPAPEPAPVETPAPAPRPARAARAQLPPGHPTTPGEWVARITKAYPGAAAKAAKAAAEARDTADAMQRLALLWMGLEDGRPATPPPQLPVSEMDAIRELCREAIRRGVDIDRVRAVCEANGAVPGYKDPTTGLSSDVLPDVEAGLRELIQLEEALR